jgi:hypothetical protein
MGFGDFLKMGASALGVDADDIGDVDSFFTKAKSVAGGGGDAGDFFGRAAKEFGIGSDDVTSAVGSVFGGDAGNAASTVGSFFGGGGSDFVSSAVGSFFGGGSGGGSGGGGFGDAVSSFFGGGDAGGATQQALGSFGSIFGGGGGAGGGILQSVASYLPSSVTDAMSEAGDLPFVRDAMNDNWADLAGSVPGLDGALGSFGISTNDVAEYVQAHGVASVDSGSGWSLGSMLGDRGTEFLRQVAEPVAADGAGWASLPRLAEHVGADLPSWATNMSQAELLDHGGRFLSDGGFVPSGTVAQTVDDIWGRADQFRDFEDIAPRTVAPHLVARSTVLDHQDLTGETGVPMQQAASSHWGGGTPDTNVHNAADSHWDEFQGSPQNAGGAAGSESQAFHAQYDSADAAPANAFQQVAETAPAADQFAATEALEQSLEDLGDDGLG